MVSHSDQFNIRWNNYTSVLQNVFRKLLEGEQFVDVTLACEGRSIKCHRVILSACSPYFEKILTDNSYPHLVIFVKDMKFWELQALVTFMYNGEVSVNQNRLSSLVKAAEALKIKGLAPDSSMSSNDTEKIDDDDLEEYQVGSLPNTDMDADDHVSRNSHHEDQSLLKPNFLSGAKKSNMKRKITVSSPKLMKMQRIERNNSGNSQLSVLSPEVLLNAGKPRQKVTVKHEIAVAPPIDDDDGTDYEGTNPEMMDALDKEENYSDEEQENGETADEANSREGPSSPSEPDEVQGTSSGTVNGNYHYKYDKDIRDSAIAALNSGMSLRQCAESFGIPRKTLSKWKAREILLNTAKESAEGEQGEGSAGQRQGKGFGAKDSSDRPERLQKAMELALSGVTVRSAAANFNIPRTTLCAYMKRRGVAAKRNFLPTATTRKAAKPTFSSVVAQNMATFEDFPFLGISELVTEMNQASFEAQVEK